MSGVLFQEPLSKFRGSMIGSLLGDCLGSPYEYEKVVKETLVVFFHSLLSGKSVKIFPYTDDTAMSMCIANSLVENRKVDAVDIAKKFVAEFYSHPERGYGNHVIALFPALRDSGFNDVFSPAKLQFHGTGSYGNGAAMRIAPMALFCFRKTYDYLKNAVEECSKITHFHPNGYNGAILQCLAVSAALQLDSSQELDPVDFICQLESKMRTIETTPEESPFCKSLEKIKEIYLQKKDMSSKEIAEYLGNGVAALRSVPSAIYSFLRGLQPIAEFECSNPFVRTIYFAISLGGDTDTIANMAGAIAGAYHGVEVIPEELQHRCESVERVKRLADQLLEIVQEDLL